MLHCEDNKYFIGMEGAELHKCKKLGGIAVKDRF